MSQPSESSETFDRYRPYLNLLARHTIPRVIQARIDPSDLVQQTIAEAWRCQDRFRGQTNATQLAWLRGILSRIAANNLRQHLGVQSRDATREMRVDELLGSADAGIESLAVASSMGPASAAELHEQILRVALAMESLSEDHQRVLRLRHFENHSHTEIAEQLGRSEAAARMLWIRALAALKQAFEQTS